MIANYHTHTWRCKHASGREREYVEQAIAGGFKILGFSDHTPYPFPDGYVSGIRMAVSQLEGYVDTVLSLKEAYKTDIDIHLGLEVEYYLPYFSELLRIVADYPVEYFLLAQHFVGDEKDGPYSGRRTKDADILRAYCRQTGEALETGRFSCFAHPDLPCFDGDMAVYREEMRRLIRRAKACKIPLEINFLGLTEGRHYPYEPFWEIAGEEGCEVVFGADAHSPETVWLPQAHAEAMRMVEKYGLCLKDTLKLRRPV